MKYLLDTHVLAWWLLDAPKLGTLARQTISDINNEIFVSAVSVYEMTSKYRIGKWPEIADLTGDFEGTLQAERFKNMPITISHALLAGQMPGKHRDPFDRMLVAQCKLENLSLITIDAALEEFGIDIIW